MINGKGRDDGLRHIDEQWEILYDGGAGFIGKVIGWQDDFMVVSPVFHYVSQPQVKPLPGGGAEFGQNARFAFPIEMLGSKGRIYLKPTRRYPINTLDDVDQRTYDRVVEDAMDMRMKVLAGRSNISLETAMPKGPPPGLIRQ